VLITGGGYGIGAAIAEAFVEAGVAHTILVGRTVSRLKATADKLSSIKSANTDISYVAVDVESKTDVRQFFESLTVSPDILINNAGYLAAPANFIDADLEDYWKSFSTNVYGTVLVTQSFLQHRRSHATSSDPAVIITLNTIGAYTVRIPLLSSYGASKAALARWSESVSVDVPESVARFISLHPGR
jgi:NAD(P)-dependent dehydrogenase (short-subunit alcohol dehydrogenase family)